VTITEVIAWTEAEVAALGVEMAPIGPNRIGYRDDALYRRWCCLKDQRDRLKTVRGHLLALAAARATKEVDRA